ncbi:unnamed protein product, partial [Rotaria magnacalcarata]
MNVIVGKVVESTS